MNSRCRDCFQSSQVVVSTAALTRAGALSHFLLLQGQGYAPTMCEGETGRYTVCVDTTRRLSPVPLLVGGLQRALA